MLFGAHVAVCNVHAIGTGWIEVVDLIIGHVCRAKSVVGASSIVIIVNLYSGLDNSADAERAEDQG